MPQCKCQYANLDDRCAGKMTCLKADVYIKGCYDLVDLFKEQSRFILSLSLHDQELTHMQLMKIRCGGLLGMQRVLSDDCNDVPDVLDIQNQTVEKYGEVNKFPFNDIVRDIKDFSHRKKR
ncbi:MAG: hypothetical protein QM504_15390 [Pseudomonadota bacterium]